MAEEIQEIFQGDLLSSWIDDEWLFLSFPFTVINLPLDEIENLPEELETFSVLLRNYLDRNSKSQNMIHNS